MILYKRNSKGEPQYWSIQEGFKGNILLDYGIVGCNGHQETIPKRLVKANEVESRVKAKRKEGYKQLCELKDSGPNEILDTIGLINYLNTYLPKNNTTSDGFILPMLAKVLKDDKPFLKTPFLGQYKINGVRCIISAEKTNDMFRPIRLIYHSREGTLWNQLSWMDDIILPNLYDDLIETMIDEGA